MVKKSQSLVIKGDFDIIILMPQISMNTHNLGIVVERLRREVGILRSFLIGMAGKDREGHYNPKFVERLLKLSQSAHEYTFESKEKFLKLLKNEDNF